MRGPIFNALVRGESLDTGLQKFGPNKIETPLYRTAQKAFRYLEPLRREPVTLYCLATDDDDDYDAQICKVRPK